MINEKKFLLKLWKEMGEALDYMLGITRQKGKSNGK
jgi:hypothetical protein